MAYQRQGYRSTQLPICCQSNVPHTCHEIKTASCLCHVLLSVNASNGKKYTQQVCGNQNHICFAGRPPLPEKHQGIAPRVIVSSMLDLITVHCGYYI